MCACTCSRAPCGMRQLNHFAKLLTERTVHPFACADPKPLAGIACLSGWTAQKGATAERVGGGANAKTPTFVGHGSIDNVVLPECAAETQTLLEGQGVPVSFGMYNTAHGAHPEELAALRGFLADALKVE